MAIRYLNVKTGHGVETLDDLNSDDFPSIREFRMEQKRLKREYQLCGSFYSGCYWSQRKPKD